MRMSAFDGCTRSAILAAEGMIADGRASCAVIKDGKTVKSEHKRGIAPIVDMYDSGILHGAVVVDKIVGRAAAMIMVLGGVAGCFGVTASRAALKYFEENGVPVEYKILCDAVINRDGSGICPMEAAVKNTDDPAEALAAVRRRLSELNGEKAQNKM